MSYKLISSNDKRLETPSKKVVPKYGHKLGKKLWRFLNNFENAVGISAVQVGILEQVFVARCLSFNATFVNPKITYYSDETDWQVEGCLSYPGEERKIERSKMIKVEFDEKDGKRKEKTYDGFIARIIQHEYDHLQGISCMKK